MITKIEVKIEYIYVSKERWFSFDWYVYENGKRKDYGHYDSSFSGRSTSAFRSVLKRGHAVRIALQQVYG